MSSPTKADLAAAVTRLAEENKGLRDLLAAVRAYADLPHPASYDNSSRIYEYELGRRLDTITVWANGDQDYMDPGVYLLVMQDRAKHLREEAARPVRYEVCAAPVITDSGRTCDQRNPDGSGEPCHRDGEHARHRDSNGDEWGEAASDEAVKALGDSIAGGTPLVISDSTIAQAEYFARPGNTIDDILAADEAAASVTA